MTGCSRLHGIVSDVYHFIEDSLSIERTGKSLRFVRRYSPKMPQITLISHKHYDNVGICVIPQFLQPSLYVLICGVLADIVDQQGTDSPTVVG